MKTPFSMRFFQPTRMLLGLVLLAHASAVAIAASPRTGRASIASAASPSAATASSDPALAVAITSPGFHCAVVSGIPWTLFREKCYYVSTCICSLSKQSLLALLCSLRDRRDSGEDVERHYKTWFEAREECAML